jgi:signal transduction histidine kinase
MTRAPRAQRSARPRGRAADGGAPSRRHIFDGGRSRAVRQSLEPLLDDVCGLLEADVAIALHGNDQGCVGVLAAAGPGVPLVNEQMRCLDEHGQPLRATSPCLLQDITLTSLVRPFRLSLSSALIVPWSDGHDGGLLLVGVVPGRWLTASLEQARRYGHSFAELHHDASYRGTVRLAEDLAAACKAVDHAELEATESGEFLASIATIARSLMGTSTAYVAMPERATGAYPFTTLIGIRTSAFRRLRMGLDQGLGGLARRERATVHTLNYSGDGRLQSAPVKETLEEGIVSAICTPLIVDDAIQGTLYLGDRRQRAFSETDAELLDAFADHVQLRLTRQHVEEHRLSVLRHRERERLASVLHDSVVRSLVEIGFHAHEGRLTTPDAAVGRLLEEIGAAAGTTLERLRGELSALGTGGDRERAPRAGELIESLRLVPRRPTMQRVFHLRGLEHDSEIPEQLYDALVSVGEEAIVNAERHARCRLQTVTLEQTDLHLRLTVVDDGGGIDERAAEAALANGSGHLGLRGMRTATQALGGYTRVSAGSGGRGTRVVAVVPLARTGG